MTFNIIHNRGQPNQADFEFQGKLFKVYREKHVFIEDTMFNRFVPCAPYDNHFIFQFPIGAMELLRLINEKRLEVEWMKVPDLLCTCGAAAIIKDQWDVKNSLLVCMFDAFYGYHQTRVVNVREFDKVRGQKFEIDGKNRIRNKYEN